MYNNEASKRSEPFFLGFPRKKTGENDSTGYTLLRHSLSTNCTLLLRTCTLIRREIAGSKTLPPDHGITA